jgi:glucose-1-phosphatase
MNKYKLIMFDLGGVLIELTGVPRMIELTNNSCTVPELWEKWITSPSVRSFESGRLKVEQFAEQIIKEFGIGIPPANYIQEFTMWPKGTYPGVNELLLKLKTKIKIASLSNTNDIHWKRFTEEMDLIHLFDYNFPSHITSYLKPDMETYLNVIKIVGIEPKEILFFDDNELNVAGAKKAGINAIKVNGIVEVEEYLKSIRII